MTHLGYVVAAYLATALVLVGMTAWTLLDLAAQKRRLSRLEAEGRGRGAERFS
jgi:heme exporter protein D